MVEKVACVNSKGIKKTSNMRPQSIPESIKNRNKIQARKRYTQKMEKHQTCDPKKMWKMKNQIDEKQTKTYILKKMEKKGNRPRAGSAEVR